MTRLAVTVAVLLAARSAAAAPAIEVRAERGIGGVVPAGGIDVVGLEVISRSDAAVAATLEVDGRAHVVELPARGRTRLVLGRRVPAGAASVPAVRVGGDATIVVPSARVLRRPVVIVADDIAAAVARIEPWRREQQLGDPIALTPEVMPARWQALAGAGAIVLDRPRDALGAELGRAVARHAAAGGLVCTIAATIDCERADAVPVPRSRVLASSGAVPRALAAIALGLAIVLLAAAAAPRRVRAPLAGVAIALAAIAAAAWSPPSSLSVRGIRVAGAGEDWVAAEIGVAETGPLPHLEGDLWIEPSGGAAALGPLDDAGFSGNPPASGSYRVRGFVPPDAAWARALEER